jgi:hypothetical protein
MLRYDHSSKEASVKVYAVSHCSEWDQFGILATLYRVFSNEQKAKQYCKENGPNYFYDIMDLE